MVDLNVAIRRIAGIGLLVGLVTTQVFSTDNDDTSFEVSEEKLNNFLRDHVVGDFSGTLLIAQNGKVIHARGYGLADREQNIPNALDTVFETGALTRYFTAAAILKLVEQNKLTLNDRLVDFFDEVPEDKRNITVHHLLTHTPGLFGDEELDAFEAVDTEAFLKHVFSRDNSISPAIYLPTFTFEPGERSIEFSEGYSLLAQIIEKRSGQTYEAFLNNQLFKPAGIKNTGYRLPDWKPEQIASGYQGEDGQKWGTLPEHLGEGDRVPIYMLGSMGLLSTVEDLYAWQRALHAGKILREDLVDILHVRHVGLNDSDEADVDYAYGIQLSETWTGTPWIYNSRSPIVRNSLPAFTTGYNYFPEEDAVIIYASNEPVSREFQDEIKMLVRVLLEPDYQPVPLDAGSQQ